MSIKKKSFWGPRSLCFSNPDLNKYLFHDDGDFFYGGKQSIGMGLLDTSLYHRYLTGPGLGKKLNYSLSLKHFQWKLKLHQAKQAKCAGHYKIWPKGLLCYFLSYMSFPWSYPIIKISSWELLSLCHSLQQTHVVTKFPMFPWVHSSRDSTI